MTVTEIKDKAFFLNDGDKQDLIDSLQETMAISNEEPPDWHGDILEKRLQKIELGEANFLSEEEFNRKLDQRINDIKAGRRSS